MFGKGEGLPMQINQFLIGNPHHAQNDVFLNPMAKTCHRFAKLPHPIDALVWLLSI